MSEYADEFFVVGGTMRLHDPSYVERPADAELFEQLRNGEFCYVLTARQMGKSSLMIRTARRLATHDVASVVIDLTGIGTVESDAWYLGLLTAVCTQLQLPMNPVIWWSERRIMSPPQRWIEFLRDILVIQNDRRLVIFIDEIDAMLGLEFRDDFFTVIRAIYNARSSDPLFQRVSFALFGVASPTDLIQDRARTPFNVGRRIILDNLSLNDAEPLRNALDECHPGAGGQILKRIFYWTNGHPFLTQKLCAAAARTNEAQWTKARVDALVSGEVLNEQSDDENLKFVQNRLRGATISDRRQMLWLYRRVYSGERIPDDDRSRVQNQLELTGLITVVNGYLQVRNRIYRTAFNIAWIDATMPRDRQRTFAIGTVMAALLLVIGLALAILLRPPPVVDLAQGYVDNFNATLSTENRANHTTRLDSLARLFALNDYRATQRALELFYALSPEQQQSMFKRSDPGNGERMVPVARSIAATLGAEDDGADLPLLNAITAGLDGVVEEGTPTPSVPTVVIASPTVVATEAQQLKEILKLWHLGRTAELQGDYETAAQIYGQASPEELNRLPALLYDRAVANTRQGKPDYTTALHDINTILEIAAHMPVPIQPTTTSDGTNGEPGATGFAVPSPDELAATATTPSGIPTVDSSGEQPSFELHNTNRFRNEQQIRRTVTELIQREPGLAQAYAATFGSGTYPALERAVPRPVIPTEVFTPTPEVAAPTAAPEAAAPTAAEVPTSESIPITETPPESPTPPIPTPQFLSFVGRIIITPRTELTPTEQGLQCGVAFESSIYGRVQTKSGIGIKGARVRVRSADGKNSFTVTTDSNGAFHVPGLGCTTWIVQLISVPGASIRISAVAVDNLTGGLYTSAEVRFVQQ